MRLVVVHGNQHRVVSSTPTEAAMRRGQQTRVSAFADLPIRPTTPAICAHKARLASQQTAQRPLTVPPCAASKPMGPETPEQASKPEWLRDLEEDAEHDPEIAALLKGANGDPDVVQKRMMASMSAKRQDIMSETTGESQQMGVKLRDIDPFNCWIWMEMYERAAFGEVEMCEEVLKSWFVLGRLGGFNTMNLQVFSGAEDGEDDVSFMEYNTEELETGMDATFHDMSNLEQKGHWLRIWVNMGTADELALDVLINTLSNYSREHKGIKQLLIGGQNEDWPVPEVQLPKSSMDPMSTDMPGDEYYDDDMPDLPDDDDY